MGIALVATTFGLSVACGAWIVAVVTGLVLVAVGLALLPSRW
jgi:hypothetical protein